MTAETALRPRFGGWYASTNSRAFYVDRTTARQVCPGIAGLVRRCAAICPGGPVAVVVATVHEDVPQWLCPDWVLETRFAGTGSAKLTSFEGPLPKGGDEDEGEEEVERIKAVPTAVLAAEGEVAIARPPRFE